MVIFSLLNITCQAGCNVGSFDSLIDVYLTSITFVTRIFGQYTTVSSECAACVTGLLEDLQN